MASPGSSAKDAVTLEIIRGKLGSLAREMGVVLARSAMSPVIYEVYDFGCGISDAEGRLIAGSHGVAAFSALFGPQIVAIKEKYAGTMRPGDIYMTNDPYLGGSHLNDVLVVQPIFEDGELIAFACCIAHWPDIGGKLDGMTTDIFSEGIQIPMLKYQRAGVVNQDLMDILHMNVRLPDRAMVDLRAQLVDLADAELLGAVHPAEGALVVAATDGGLQHQAVRLRRRAVEGSLVVNHLRIVPRRHGHRERTTKTPRHKEKR